MSQWSNLPTEILEIVFSYLGAYEYTRRNYLPQCALTCRLWKLPAHKEYFKIKVVGKRVDIQKAKAVLSAMDGANLGMFVKEIHYGYQGVDASRLELLDAVFPRLEKINYLYPNDVLFSIIFKMITIGKFQWLRILPTPTTDHYEELYVQCAQLLKSRLQHIHLTHNIISKRRGTYQHLHDKLNQYPCLESISADIFSVSAQTVWDFMETILSTSIHGPLKKVCLHISAQSDNSILSQKVNQIMPSFNLKQLTLSYKGIILNNDINLLYFMKKFPNLTSLRIPYSRWLEYPENFSFPSPPSSMMVAQFLDYIRKIPDNSEVDCIIINEETVSDIILELFERIKSDPADKENITICIHHLRVDWLKKTHSCRPAMIDISTDAKKNSNTCIEFSFKREDNDAGLKYLDLMEKAGSHFRESLFLDHPIVQPNTALLDHVIKYCVNLSSLDISGGKELGDYSQPATVKSNSLKTLILRGYTITEEFCSFIQERLPNLRHLRIGDCYGSPAPELCVPIYFPSTAFKYLEIDTTAYPDRLNYNSISIRVKNTKAKKYHYYRLNKIEPNTDLEDVTFAYKVDERRNTQKQFELDMMDGKCLVFDIYCKSIKKIYIDYVPENGEKTYLSIHKAR